VAKQRDCSQGSRHAEAGLSECRILDRRKKCRSVLKKRSSVRKGGRLRAETRPVAGLEKSPGGSCQGVTRGKNWGVGGRGGVGFGVSNNRRKKTNDRGRAWKYAVRGALSRQERRRIFKDEATLRANGPMLEEVAPPPVGTIPLKSQGTPKMRCSVKPSVAQIEVKADIGEGTPS